jgi:pimeloyl-ACP methyl ester carboxylesterase
VKHSSAFLTGPEPLYYDELLPDTAARRRVILLHGGGVTGSCYLTTPDGRPGWAHTFVEHGYGVLVPDWPGTGRSAAIPPDMLTGDVVCRAIGRLIEDQDNDVVLVVHSMSGPYGFRLLETHGDRITALVAVAPGPPGNIQPEPAVLDETEEEIEIQGLALRWRIPRTGLWWPTESFLHDKLVGTSTRFPRHALDTYRQQLGPIPARLLQERQNVHGSQLHIVDPRLFKDKPVLVVTGDHDTDHTRENDADIAAWLDSLGADVTFRFLDDPVHSGNGHLLMGEDNSDTIAALVISWLDAAGGEQRPNPT